MPTETSDTKNHGRPFHEILPLVTVIRHIPLINVLGSGFFWNSHDLESTAAPEIARKCGDFLITIPRGRYYYAGFADGQYGDIAFAYGPDHESGQRGSAHPFDTGALILGGLHPFFKHPKHSRPLCQFVADTTVQLAGWRDLFKRFIDLCYDGDVIPYLNGDRPPKPANYWTTPQLPSYHSANIAPQAWTWEVVIHSQPEVERGLIAWSCYDDIRKEVVDTLNDFKGKEPTFPADRIDACLPLLQQCYQHTIGKEPCDVMQQKIVDWVQEQIRPKP
ncbi:MAG: hypothetical protein HQL07_04975 [Nitrospirae bacterium]|nr:hypothetical protein [Magnetococcales bacterium]HAT49344.1 hypothetical protein [Alphaproteobacteria bacterium]